MPVDFQEPPGTSAHAALLKYFLPSLRGDSVPSFGVCDEVVDGREPLLGGVRQPQTGDTLANRLIQWEV